MLERRNWWDFDGVDAPVWAPEADVELFCNMLNSYVPQRYRRTGTRYHVLNHFGPNGEHGLYYHLLNRPAGLEGGH
jgi:hypothetical protein